MPWRVNLSPSSTSRSGALLMATFSSTIHVNVPYERVTDLTVPPTATEGTWYVVAVMDPDHTITERNESNNTAVWNQQVEVVLTPSGCGCASSGSPARAVGAAIGLVALLWASRRRG